MDPNLPEMPHVNHPPVLSHFNLTTHFPGARPPCRRIHFPNLWPQKCRELSLQLAQDIPTKFESVVADLTHSKWVWRAFCRQAYYRHISRQAGDGRFKRPSALVD